MPSQLPSDFLPLTHDAFLVLISLAAEGRHGYGIMRDVEERSEGAVTLQTGALYRTLRRMLDDGLIEECDPPSDEAATDDRRRFYRRTPFGGEVLQAEADRMARLVKAARLTMQGRRTRLA